MPDLLFVPIHMLIHTPICLHDGAPADNLPNTYIIRGVGSLYNKCIAARTVSGTPQGYAPVVWDCDGSDSTKFVFNQSNVASGR